MDTLKTPTALGTERVSKLLMQYAIPAIIAMTASSLYNMVDSIFIGQGVGPMAISGLALTFPLMNLSAAFGTLVGIGGATLLSMKLGQKDYSSAQNILGNVFVLNIAIGVVFTVVALPLLDPILYFFGGSEQTVPYAHDYMEVILTFNALTHLYLGLNAMLRSSGHPRQAMIATVATVALNTVLDPIFIYGLGWGIRGAAIATVLSQVVSLIWEIRLFSKRDELIHFRRGAFRIRRRIATASLAIGMAPFLMNVASCFVVVLINQGLKRHGGDLAIGAFGISNRLVFIILMVVIGLNQGMQPIAGYNFGARQFDRVRSVLFITVAYATVVTTLGFIVGMACPRALVGIFTTDEELRSIAARALRIMVASFPLVGGQMVISNFFQSIGRAGQATFLSLTRQLLYLLPCLLILPVFFGLSGVWFCMPAADVLAAITAAIMLARHFRKTKQGAFNSISS